MLHNVPLPALGSFEFNLLHEGIRRQRAEKISFARLLAGLIAPISGLEKEEVTILVSRYAEEVMQFNYNSKYEPVYLKLLRARVDTVNEDQLLLAKVNAMTVTDEDLK